MPRPRKASRMEIGIVRSTSIAKNRDGTTDVRLVQVEVSDPLDIRTAQLAGPIDHNPRNGTRVLLVDAESAWQFAIVVEDIVAAVETAIGEKVLAATDSNGDQKSYLALRSDGNLELNGTADFGVRFSELEAAFNQLKSDLNNVVTFINGATGVGHVHTCPVGGGSTTAMTGTAVASSADISDAKVETVLMP